MRDKYSRMPMPTESLEERLETTKKSIAGLDSDIETIELKINTATRLMAQVYRDIQREAENKKYWLEKDKEKLEHQLQRARKQPHG